MLWSRFLTAARIRADFSVDRQKGVPSATTSEVTYIGGDAETLE